MVFLWDSINWLLVSFHIGSTDSTENSKIQLHKRQITLERVCAYPFVRVQIISDTVDLLPWIAPNFKRAPSAFAQDAVSCELLVRASSWSINVQLRILSKSPSRTLTRRQQWLTEAHREPSELSRCHWPNPYACLSPYRDDNRPRFPSPPLHWHLSRHPASSLTIPPPQTPSPPSTPPKYHISMPLPRHGGIHTVPPDSCTS